MRNLLKKYTSKRVYRHKYGNGNNKKRATQCHIFIEFLQKCFYFVKIRRKTLTYLVLGSTILNSSLG